MLLVHHTVKFTNSIGESHYTDSYQLCENIDEAREAVNRLISIHGDELDCYAICQIIESSNPSWQNVKPMGLED